MVILYCDMSIVDIGMGLLQTKANWKALWLDDAIAGLNIGEGLAGKDGPAIFCYGGT